MSSRKSIASCLTESEVLFSKYIQEIHVHAH